MSIGNEDLMKIESNEHPSLCECGTWCRPGQKIITKHHPTCKHYSLEDDAKEIIVGLLRGIEAWASDEDGVHPDCWDAYRRAKAAVWELREFGPWGCLCKTLHHKMSGDGCEICNLTKSK